MYNSVAVILTGLRPVRASSVLAGTTPGITHMPAVTPPGPVRFLTRFFSRLRFPYLFALVVTLFGLDLLLPDLIPFVDELLLGLASLLLGSWKQHKANREQAASPTGPADAQSVSRPTQVHP